jgi:hypothetical protein
MLGAAASKPAHEVVHQDLPADGAVAQSRRRDDGCAVTVTLLPRHVARAHADAHREAPSIVDAPVGAVDRALDGGGGGNRVGGGAESRHHAVAQPFDQGAAVVFDGGRQELIVRAAQLVGRAIAEPAPQLRGTDEIGEQDRRRPRLWCRCWFPSHGVRLGVAAR